jgi:hypothetical protein
MYSRCPVCTANLGRNEVLEGLPIGSRIAFDLARGRVWALCAQCRSWNLVPVGEEGRGIAEEAERAFGRGVVGVSSERIALGRVRDGTELIRVGGASEGEIAGWRYGRRLVGRWRRHRVLTVGSVGVAAGLALVPAVGIMTATWLYAGAAGAGLLAQRLRTGRPVFMREGNEGAGREDEDPGGSGLFRERDVTRILLLPGEPEDGGWRVALDRWYLPPLELTRDEGRRAMRAMLARWNFRGGSPEQVRRATERVLDLGSVDQVFARAARDLNQGNAWEHHLAWPFRDTARIQWADPTLRLALEIASNDELERRVLEGELHLLEREWEEAEELARIAESLGRWSGRGDRMDH